MSASEDFEPWFGELSLSTENAYWGCLTANFLVRLGLQFAVISPGSRSAPLTYAFARHPGIETVTILDERSAAHYALGRAKASGRPTALICTSGTAAANYYPAVIEARYSHTPLLLLTADRPHELRNCHSGQTIEQRGLYAGYPVFEAESDYPSLDEDAAQKHGSMLSDAWSAATGAEAGAAHVNFPFRDPLAPVRDGRIQTTGFDPGVLVSGFTRLEKAEQSVSTLPFETGGQGLLITGPAVPPDPEAYCRGVAGLSRHLGCPVLAEALSPLRNYSEINPYLISGYDVLLQNKIVSEKWIPDYVIQLGSLPTSKRLRTWLESHPVPTLVIDPSRDSRDPLNRPVRMLHQSVEGFADLEPSSESENTWLKSWMGAETRYRELLDSGMDEIRPLFEGKIPHYLTRHLPPDSPVFIANSMPVRDAEYFWPVNDRHFRIFCNRGANGIEGTLSTALGMAHDGPPGYLVTGDLALLHDTNGLLARRQFRGSLTIILINNGGGAIFDNLPVREIEEVYETHFRTPQEIPFSSLCATYEVGHRIAESWEALDWALDYSAGEKGIRVIEIPTDPSHDVDFRRSFMAKLATEAVYP